MEQRLAELWGVLPRRRRVPDDFDTLLATFQVSSWYWVGKNPGQNDGKPRERTVKLILPVSQSREATRFLEDHGFHSIKGFLLGSSP